jgi:hypothetical protein
MKYVQVAGGDLQREFLRRTPTSRATVEGARWPRVQAHGVANGLPWTVDPERSIRTCSRPIVHWFVVRVAVNHCGSE